MMHGFILSLLTLLCAVGTYAVIRELAGARYVSEQWEAEEACGQVGGAE